MEKIRACILAKINRKIPLKNLLNSAVTKSPPQTEFGLWLENPAEKFIKLSSDKIAASNRNWAVA